MSNVQSPGVIFIHVYFTDQPYLKAWGVWKLNYKLFIKISIILYLAAYTICYISSEEIAQASKFHQSQLWETVWAEANLSCLPSFEEQEQYGYAATQFLFFWMKGNTIV